MKKSSTAKVSEKAQEMKSEMEFVFQWAQGRGMAAAALNDFVKAVAGKDATMQEAYTDENLAKCLIEIKALAGVQKALCKVDGIKWTGSPKHTLLRGFENAIRKRFRVVRQAKQATKKPVKPAKPVLVACPDCGETNEICERITCGSCGVIYNSDGVQFTEEGETVIPQGCELSEEEKAKQHENSKVNVKESSDIVYERLISSVDSSIYSATECPEFTEKAILKTVILHLEMRLEKLG